MSSKSGASQARKQRLTPQIAGSLLETNKHRSILAFDLGTKTGYAVLANGIITSGNINLDKLVKQYGIQKEHPGSKYQAWHQWLQEAFKLYKPQEVCYEEVMRFMSGDWAKLYGGLRSQLLRADCSWRVFEEADRWEGANYGTGELQHCTGYHPTTVKLCFAGSGTAKKPDMVATAEAVVGQLLSSEDEADAIAVLFTHLIKTTE